MGKKMDQSAKQINDFTRQSIGLALAAHDISPSRFEMVDVGKKGTIDIKKLLKLLLRIKIPVFHIDIPMEQWYIPIKWPSIDDSQSY
ncbi:MAG: hypothetical protein R2769_02475 [Saprospiraceae bacterium]